MTLTRPAERALAVRNSIYTFAELQNRGFTARATHSQLAARRWQRFGAVVLTHNGPPSARQRRAIALLNCGPHALLTAFSSAEYFGLTGWDRETTHVLVPGGSRVRRLAVAPVRVHFAGDWARVERVAGRRLHKLAPSMLLAAATLSSPRSACGLLAAGVQHRLVHATDLRIALDGMPRLRHRRVMALALGDIEQGAHALSEIDFARLCRRHKLPEPRRQRLRREPSGRNRYLDVEWIRSDGRRVVAEIDGAGHLDADRWWADQSRQNELTIADDSVLRFPSIVLRTAEAEVVDQLRRMLLV